MKQHRTLLGAVLFAAAAVVLVLARPWAPSYEGKSIKTWFYAAGNFRSPPDLEADRRAFRAMGSNAVPFLIAKLEDAPSERIKRFLSVIRPARADFYRQQKQMWQHRAANLLGEIGPAARTAEPSLVKWASSGHWAIQGAATVALMKIRQQPPDALIEVLKDTRDPQAWYENAMMVGQFGSRAESAVPILLEALQHTNSVIQGHALIALGMIARQPDKCIPAIVPFLASPSVSDRQKAIGALRDFGTNALPAKAAIQGALSDSDPWVKLQAELALKKLKAVGDSQGGNGSAQNSPGQPVGSDR